MKKVWIIMLMLMLPIVYGISECQREESEIPCNVISSWHPSGNCADNAVMVYNITGENIINYTWGEYTPFCNFTFSINQSGTYVYNSSIESGIITVGLNDMTALAIIILLPIIFGVILFYGASKLGDNHPAFKWFTFLLLPLTVFASFHFAALTIVKYYSFPELQDLIGSSVWWIGGVFFVMLCYALIYFFIVFTRAAAQDKEDKIEY